MLSKTPVALSRRQFLKYTLGGTAGFLVGNSAALANKKVKGKAEPYAGLRMGLQSYSFRNFPFDKAVVMTSELGLKYLEAFPGHLPPEQKGIPEAKKLLNQHKVKVVAYGVVGLSNDEKQARPLFEFAKAMGIEMLSADPDPDSFDLLDKLVKEFGIAVGIHNHGPGHRYATVESILKAIKGHHPKIGVCLDTGHLARAGDDPVKAVRTFKSRLHGIHLKDVNQEKHDVIIGTGVLDIKGFLKALKEVKFKGCLALEYELQPTDPLPGIRTSLEFLRKSCEKLK